MTESLEVKPLHTQRKYSLAKLAAMGLILMGLILAAGIAYVGARPGFYPEGEEIYKYIIPITFLAIAAYGVKFYRDTAKEEFLITRLTDKNLIMNEQGITGPITLLEGPSRDKLLQQGQARFFIRWPEIENFIVEPTRARRSSHSPPYFKITLTGKKPDFQHGFFIRREFVKAREKEIVAFAETTLGADKIVLNDEISNG